MKKIILTVCFLLMAQMFTIKAASADEIINSKGEITPCKIETVSDGIVEYQINGCRYSFQRILTNPVFSDYIDVKNSFVKKDAPTTRFTGTVTIKDFGGACINTKDGDVQIPWYRVKFIGIYNPN